MLIVGRTGWCVHSLRLSSMSKQLNYFGRTCVPEVWIFSFQLYLWLRFKMKRRVYCRCKADFGAAGWAYAQSRFWCSKFRDGTKLVLEQAQSRLWSGWFRVGTKPVLEQAQSRFWSRHKAGFGAVGLGSEQSRFWSRHKAGFGATGLA